MSDPKRLIDTRSGLARDLLQAGRSDAPSSASVQRALASVSVAAAATAASSSSAAATGAALWLKWLGIGVASGLLSMGAVQVVSSAVSAPPAPTAVAPAAATHVPRQAVATSPQKAEPIQDEADPDLETPKPAATGNTAPHATDVPKSEPPPDSLSAELSRIDAARLRLNGGNAQGTLTLLDAYARDYPSPNFGQEALLLRIESHIALGQCARAQALGSGFLKLHAGSAFGQRVRSLLARCGSL